MLDDVPIRIPAELLVARMHEKLPAILTGNGTGLDAKARTMRLLMKPVIREVLSLLDGEMQKTNWPYPRPVRPEGMDWLQFGTVYLMGLALSVLESQPWHLECVETEDGIQVTGLAELAPRLSLGAAELGETTTDDTAE